MLSMSQDERGKKSGDLLDHFGGVFTVFFYENSVVGEQRIPRFERAGSMDGVGVELKSLAQQSTRVRQTRG